MSSAQSVQTVLRFLSQDAKLPLAQALAKVKDLQAASLITASDLSKADFPTLKTIFADDEKLARQVLNAAKRVCKKRSASDAMAPTTSAPSSSKKIKPLINEPLSASELEASLALPSPELDEDKLKATTLYTNRAPLVLAFAVVLTKFTMPQQPLSSRLSLAQAVTSMNSKSKAVSIGIESGRAAEDEEWGEGQPVVRIMTRDVRVMKRWGYAWESAGTQVTVAESTQGTSVKQEGGTVKSSQDTIGFSQDTTKSSRDTLVEELPAREPALWAIDLEALKRANQNGANKPSGSQLPIYTAQSARSYLLKAFESPKASSTTEVKGKGGTTAKRTAASIAAEKERNLGLLLGALELLFRSWALLSKEDLDKKAWGWYVRVRPDVAHGTAGWGGKGNVNLSDIWELRRP